VQVGYVLLLTFHTLVANGGGLTPEGYANFNTLRTDDADLRLYITTVQDG